MSEAAHTWIIHCTLDDEKHTYRVESQEAIDEGDAIGLLVEKLNQELDGVHVLGNFEARPVKAPLMSFIIQNDKATPLRHNLS